MKLSIQVTAQVAAKVFTSLLTLFLSLQASAQLFPFPFPLPDLPGLPGSDSFAGAMPKVSLNGLSASVYVPETVKAKPGLLVVLHGCTQSGSDMAKGAKLNAAADKYGFIAMYPEQTYSANPLKCWNWFRTENQERIEGSEAQAIVDLVETQIAEYNVDRKKVVLLGFSAGGAMATNMLACYSDVFTAGVIGAGLEFSAATTESGAHMAMSQGPSESLQETSDRAVTCLPKRKALIPLLNIHGSSDYTVNPVNFERTNNQFVYLNSIVAEELYGKVKVTESKGLVEGNGLDANMVDVKINGKSVLKSYLVKGMGHAWSGGTSAHMESRGIDAATLVGEEFFQ